ncbi:MAG: hypothetical protein FD134_2111 [Gallionellaceae bacterium]|nr:MAG: hypothetical protein FD134_2111 [Gallionellaceae bacterium]
MNSRNFFYNAALILGLATTGISFADEVTTVDPSSMTQQEREAYRTERQASMTPEQRAEKQASHSQGGSAQGQGTMARDGSGSGRQYGRSGGTGGGQGNGMGGGRGRGGR